MEHNQYRSHDPGKHLRGCGETKTKDWIGTLSQMRQTEETAGCRDGQGPEGRHPSSRWRPSNLPSELHEEPTGWSPSWKEFEEWSSSSRKDRLRASKSPMPPRQQIGDCNNPERGELARLLPSLREKESPRAEHSLWWSPRNSWEGEPEREEAAMKMEWDVPSSRPPPPKVPPLCPSRWTSGGRGSRRPWETRDMAPTLKDFFEVGDLRIPLDLRAGDVEEGHLESQELREKLL